MSRGGEEATWACCRGVCVLRPLERPLGAVERAPERYAPFYDRVAAHFAISVEQARAALARIDGPAAWKNAGLPGIQTGRVDASDTLQATEAVIVRFAPGKRFPRHVHRGAESVLLLEGGYVDDRGVRCRAGDMHEMPAGSRHGFVVDRDGPCVAVAVNRGIDFSAWPLRLLSWILGRD